MAEREVPISASMTYGWETFKANALFLLGVFVAVFLVSTVMEGAAKYDAVETGFARVILEIISSLVQIALELGLVVIVLKFVDGETPEFADLFSRIRLVFHCALAAIVCFFIVAFGLVLLIVPGIVFSIRLSFFPYFIADEGCGPLDAPQKSWDLTRGHVISLLLFYIVIVGINIAGMLALGVGIFVTIPISSLMMGYVFRQLQGPPPDTETQVAQAA